MTYNEDLTERTRRQLSDRTDGVERKMFGGLAFSWAHIARHGCKTKQLASLQTTSGAGSSFV